MRFLEDRFHPCRHASAPSIQTELCLAMSRPLQRTPADRGGSLLVAAPQATGSVGSTRQLTEQRAEQQSRQAAGSPVAIASGDVHPDHVSGVVVIAERFNPGNGIGDRFIEAAVLPIELSMRFTAAVDQAIRARCLLGTEALHRRPSWQITMAGFLTRVCIRLNIEISRYVGQQSAFVQPHDHRLKPLHPAALALLAMQHGVPVAPAPVRPPGSAAATPSRAAGCGRPGAAIQPKILADPHRTLRAHRAVWICSTDEPLAAAHLGGRSGGRQVWLVYLPSRALIYRHSSSPPVPQVHD